MDCRRHLISKRSLSVASIESAICAAEFPSGVADGDHCGVTNLKVSTVDPNWVFAAVGFYNAQDQPENNGTEVILNLSTHQARTESLLIIDDHDRAVHHDASADNDHRCGPHPRKCGMGCGIGFICRDQRLWSSGSRRH
jgi:hypothetical protein